MKRRDVTFWNLGFFILGLKMRVTGTKTISCRQHDVLHGRTTSARIRFPFGISDARSIQAITAFTPFPHHTVRRSNIGLTKHLEVLNLFKM
jgi:hypothetical protein